MLDTTYFIVLGAAFLLSLAAFLYADRQKKIAQLLLFLIPAILFLVLGVASFGVEVVGCTDTLPISCGVSPLNDENSAYLFFGLGSLMSVLGLIKFAESLIVGRV